jgi:hypothetical protein
MEALGIIILMVGVWAIIDILNSMKRRIEELTKHLEEKEEKEKNDN